MANLIRKDNGDILVENTTVLIKGAMEQFKFNAPIDAKVNIDEISNVVVVDIKEKKVKSQTIHPAIYENTEAGLWVKYYEGDAGAPGSYQIRLTNKEGKIRELGKERLVMELIKAADKIFENFILP